MRIAVTGGSGLIGSALVPRLVERSDEVVRLVRRPPEGTEVYWNPATGDIDADRLEGLDALVHLAGRPIGLRLTRKNKDGTWSSRVEGTRLIADAIRSLASPPQTLVSASAIGYYGDRGDDDLTEGSAKGTGFMADLCEAWEHAAAAASSAGTRVATIRTGLVMAGTDRIMQRMLPAFKLGVGGRIGDGRQWWSWIALSDEARAIVHIIDVDELSGPVNLTAPQPLQNAEFAATLGRVLGRPSAFAVPAFAARLAFGEEAAAEFVLAGQKVLPARLLASGFRFDHQDLDSALRAVLKR